MTATVAVEVWMRPCDSVADACTRCVPPSHLKTEYAPSPLTANDRPCPAGLVGLGDERLGLEAAALCIAGQHPVRRRPRARPRRRRRPGGLDDDVLRVGRIRSTSASFSSSSTRASPPRPGRHLAELRSSRASSRSGRPAPLLREPVRRRAPSAPPDLGGFTVVVVDGRIRHRSCARRKSARPRR